MKRLSEILAALPDAAASEFRGEHRMVVPRESLFSTLQTLKDGFGFDLLVDVTCVDYLDYEGKNAAGRPRFGLVYLLADTTTNERLTVRCFVEESEPEVASIVSLWEGANWLEREVWDMFGIRFAGHPDLRRVLLPDAFVSYPLRKDYPLQGLGERHNFERIRRGEG